MECGDASLTCDTDCDQETVIRVSRHLTRAFCKAGKASYLHKVVSLQLSQRRACSKTSEEVSSE